MATLTDKLYLHADSDVMWEKGEQLGLLNEALKMFSMVGYEVDLDIEIDSVTGEVVAVAVSNVPLSRPVAL